MDLILGDRHIEPGSVVVDVQRVAGEQLDPTPVTELVFRSIQEPPELDNALDVLPPKFPHDLVASVDFPDDLDIERCGL